MTNRLKVLTKAVGICQQVGVKREILADRRKIFLPEKHKKKPVTRRFVRLYP
jgi:hypothetical protein